MRNKPVLQVDRISTADSRFGAAKRWEYEIFGLENGYTNNTDDAAQEMCQYLRWDASSEFYVGFADAAASHPVAILRALRWDPALGVDSFSTIYDARAYPNGRGPDENMLFPEWQKFFANADSNTIAELATQAVRRSHRRTGVIEQIWSQFFTTLAADGVRYVTVALVIPLFNWYKMLIGDAISQIGRVLPDYVGADSVPAIVELDGLKRALLAA
jgi:hypothetical protein